MVPEPSTPGGGKYSYRDSWGLIYHTLASAYGWTVAEINELTLPQLRALMAEFGNTDGKPVTRMPDPSEKALDRLGAHVQVQPKKEDDGSFLIRGRNGKIVKAYRKSDLLKKEKVNGR